MNARIKQIASPDFVWPWTVLAHRHADLLCALFVSFGLVVWWAWSERGRHAKFEPRPVATPMVWLDETRSDRDGAWRPSSRAVSPPVLFALPTPQGFSRGALGAPGLRPPPPQIAEYFVPKSSNMPASPVARVERMQPRDAAAKVRFLAWPHFGDADALNTPGATSPVLVVVWQREGIATQTRVLSVESNSVWADVQPWEAVARVDLDSQGWADRVLLEKPAAVTNRNATIVQLLRTMNFGTKGAGSGRVAVRYEGSPAGPPPLAVRGAPP